MLLVDEKNVFTHGRVDSHFLWTGQPARLTTEKLSAAGTVQGTALFRPSEDQVGCHIGMFLYRHWLVAHQFANVAK